MTFVILIDKQSSARPNICNWLSRNGLITWLANDFFHVIEELSDFTVRNRPDVVLLEVAFLEESYGALRTTLNMASGDVTVVGLGNYKLSNEKSFAADVDQLGKMMVRKKVGSSCRLGN